MQQRNQAGSNDNGGGDVLSNQIISKISPLHAILLTVCVCVCVCVCACVRACVHACVRACMFICFDYGRSLLCNRLHTPKWRNMLFINGAKLVLKKNSYPLLPSKYLPPRNIYMYSPGSWESSAAGIWGLEVHNFLPTLHLLSPLPLAPLYYSSSVTPMAFPRQ